VAGVLLSADSVSKSFSGVIALRGVSFDVHAGEVHALVGENGAGKSTLIKVMTGAEAPDSGLLTVGARPYERIDPAAAHALGIAVVHQQPSLFPHLTIAENLAIGVEHMGPLRRVNWQGRRQRAHDLLARVGASLDPDRLVETLTMPEQQLVEIARALGADARILVMDEPTSSLTTREVDLLLEVVRRLRSGGVGIVYVTHRLEEVFQVADRITVLRDGKSVTTLAAGDATVDGLIKSMVGRDLSSGISKRAVEHGETVLELRRLSSSQAGIRDISLTVRRGEILGLAGLVGSGRTQLAEAIFGLRQVDAGEILVDGRIARVRSPADAIRMGIAYVPEDRRRHGVIGDMSVAANNSLASLRSIANAGWLDFDAEQRLADRYMNQLGIVAPSVDALAGSLSGGNQQKVSLARWLATSPRVLILDEPTQGVDVASKAEIHRIVQDLAEGGLAVVMISSDLPEVLGLSDRVAVMRGGIVAGVLSREEATEQSVLTLAFEPAKELRP
jgi:rhamnose transport system ATP-binding protein